MIKVLHKQLAQKLKFFSVRSALYYDKKRNKDITLKEENKVYLLRKNIKTTKLSSKLDYVKIGPFRILRSIKGISFKLDLPSTIRIHPVFHALLLKPADNATPTAVIKLGYIDSQEEWEVEEVLDE